MDTSIKARIDEINNSEIVRWYFSLLGKLIGHHKIDSERAKLFSIVFVSKAMKINMGDQPILFYKDSNGNDTSITFILSKAEYNKHAHKLKVKPFVFKLTASGIFVNIDINFLYIKSKHPNIDIFIDMWIDSCVMVMSKYKKRPTRDAYHQEIFNMALDKKLLESYLTDSVSEPFSELPQIEILPPIEIHDAQTTLDLDSQSMENPINLESTELDSQSNLNPQIVENALVNMKKMSLNQILYGSPGTGKTYHTIYKALEIIGFDITGKDRKTCKAVFDEYVKNGQIVFTTFHQSMNYEDFMEGIKPVELKNEGENLSYKIEAGIFKRLVIEAAFAVAKVKKLENSTESHDFSSQYDQYIADIDEKLMVGKRPLVKSRNDAYISIDSISSNRNIIIRHVDSPRTYIVSKERLMKLNKAFPQLETIQNINTAFQEVIGGANMSAYWAILNDIRQNGSKKVDKKMVFTWEEKSQVVSEMQKNDYICSHSDIQPPNFVLIIDEINRGNVSQIFGELITLIEETKRLGRDEALEIMLPYSKQLFGVPSNLYIIGTMNTADRSVEALDTALRRRFVFEEMMPQIELLKIVDGIDLANLLKIINERIETLLNRDSLIGHSYFLNVASVSDLKNVFFNNIIPLLQEYFYGDYGKMGLVLGNGFVRIKKDDYKQKVKFANFFYEDKDLLQKNVYEIIPNKPDFDIKNALNLLLNE